MTHTPHATTNNRISSIFPGFGTAFDQIRRAIGREKARRQLIELDDRILNDIGLSRSDIAAGRF